MKAVKDLLFSISAFFALFSLADCADCEAYKTQVVNDCDSLLVECGYIRNTFGYIETYCNTIDNNVSSSGSSVILNSTDNIRRNCTGGISTVSAIENFVNAVKLTAQSLQCNASSNTVSSCDCSQYLQSLVDLLTTCNQTIAGVKSGLDSISTSIGSTTGSDSDIVSTLNTIRRSFEDFSFFVNAFLSNDDGDLEYTISDFYNLYSSITNGLFASGSTSRISSQRLERPAFFFYSGSSPGTFDVVVTRENVLPSGYSAPAINDLSLMTLLRKHIQQSLLYYNSQLTYDYTNLVASSSVASSLDRIDNRFSIFNDFVFSADAPLSMYTDKQTDGSYHDYLTNYYIKVSKGQQSGSDSFTNWFSRVELLLAALVFQDEDDSTINTNGVPSESDKDSVTEVGSSLGQTISGFVQDGNSHVSSVDTSGKSIIRMVTSWNTAIGQTAKPAPFVVAEFTAPDSQSRSNVSLWLDTEDERLSSLIEIGHGISTLAWVAVFLLLGYNLAVYSIRVLRKLISFSFSLYSAIFGGG